MEWRENEVDLVYEFVNLHTGKRYIGSTYFYKRRRIQHLTALRSGKASCKSLQMDFDKYGESYFEFRVICECNDTETSRSIELSIIKNSFIPTYNVDAYNLKKELKKIKSN